MSFFLKTIFFGRKTENPLFSLFSGFSGLEPFRPKSGIMAIIHGPGPVSGPISASRRPNVDDYGRFSLKLLRKFHFLMPEPTFANIG